MEESAKSFLIFSCLLKTQTKGRQKHENSSPFDSDIKENIEDFLDKIDCPSALKKAFYNHEVKIETIRNLGILLKCVIPNYDWNKDTTTEFLKNQNPKINENIFEKLLNQPEAINTGEKFAYELFESMIDLSDTIKENGIYVNCNTSVFVFPKIEKETITKMADSLYSIIYALTISVRLFGEERSLWPEIINFYPKIGDLKRRMDEST